MSIAVAATCVRTDCRQPAVRMIHCSSNGHGSGPVDSTSTGPYLLTYRCSVCGHTWAVTRDTPLANATMMESKPEPQRGW